MDALDVILCIFLAASGYTLARNHFVWKFRGKIIDLCHEHNIRKLKEGLDYESAYEWFYDKHSYYKMVFSFKPLELEYWWTKEEIERLMN